MKINDIKVRHWQGLLAAGLLISSGGAARAITFEFDYSFDTNNFFSDLSRRTALEAAADVYETLFTDSLAAIETGVPSTTWDLEFFNPATGTDASVTDRTVAANTVLVFAGGRNLGSAAGIGGPGAWTVTESGNSFFNLIQGRGNPGALGPNGSQTDFAPWGGSITFDTVTDFYFDPDVSTVGDLPFAKFDFYTVAFHELGHLLGFGIAPSWDNLLTSNGGDFFFDGAVSNAVFGGPPPIFGDQGHWDSGLMSPRFGSPGSGQPLMDPTLTNGTRKFITELDLAGFADFGWEVAAIPEPSALALLALAACAWGWLHVRRPNRSPEGQPPA